MERHAIRMRTSCAGIACFITFWVMKYSKSLFFGQKGAARGTWF